MNLQNAMTEQGSVSQESRVEANYHDVMVERDYNESTITGDVPIADSSSGDKIREFSVRQLNYGYIITVGCHSFAIETHEKVTKMIGQYLADPTTTERKWWAKELDFKG